MRRVLTVLGGVVAVLLGTALFAMSGEQPPPAFAPGETFTYDVSWSIFNAGQVVAKLEKDHQYPGDDYVINTTATSTGFVSLLYKVQDHYRSVFDPQTLCSRSISKTINEGRRHKETKIVFDPLRKLAVLYERDLNKPDDPPTRKENEIPACVEDVVSAFYFLRRQPMRVGQKIRLAVNDGSKTKEVTVEVQAREQIQTPLGTFEAFRVEPTVFGSLYKRKGRMLIWFSDDARRLPLRIKATISVGAITGTLTSFTSGSASAHPAR